MTNPLTETDTPHTHYPTQTTHSMKSIIASITLLILAMAAPMAGHAADPGLVEMADSAYSSDDFATAAQLYTEALDSLGTSSQLYYNLGNTYYRMGKPGKAVAAYERSLRLDPTNHDARTNLDFVNSRLIDRPGERGTLFGNMLDKAALALHSNTWAWLALAAFIIFLGAVALYLFCPVVAWRKVGFFGGFVVLAVTVVAALLALRNASICTATDRAVITVPSTILSTSPRTPRDRSEEAILLHEGTTMQVIDSVSSRTDSVKTVWVDVQIDNSHRAWIRRDAIEMI